MCLTILHINRLSIFELYVNCAGILTMIMVRTLRRDIARYNAGESDSLAGLDETIEETGWKLVHGDVFRPPTNSRLFAAVIGSGIQIFFMALITICRCTIKFSMFQRGI